MMLRGRISGGSSLKCSLSGSSALSGKLVMGGSTVPVYRGETSFIPSEEQQTISIAGMQAVENLVIEPIPSNYGRIEQRGAALRLY